jgi:transcription initiation factor IIE alpha subunit
MFQWFWDLCELFKKKEYPLNSQDRIQPMIQSSDGELQIRKPKIFMCTSQECKNIANYKLNEAYNHSFKCLDCKLPLSCI